ncbi:MAG: hypothetical protein JWP63_4862 [Candidatus Solibacter sp.]|jgi:hypothetical protein|nr:hypothetical protein [Candidatus Solibacter sp.]
MIETSAVQVLSCFLAVTMSQHTAVLGTSGTIDIDDTNPDARPINSEDPAFAG